MPNSIEDKLKELQRRKNIIQTREKKLQEKARQKRARKFIEVGRLAYKANIDEMDPESLLGAFSEIAELMEDQAKLTYWSKRGRELQQKSSSKEELPLLVITFAGLPSDEEKKKLKQQGFRWYAARKEFYGRGNEDQLRSILSGSNYTLKLIIE